MIGEILLVLLGAPLVFIGLYTFMTLCFLAVCRLVEGKYED